ncbi:MAG: HEAT repeat protein [Oleiphilaceae bacterium]|jgi:HEAT repeat protein
MALKKKKKSSVNSTDRRDNQRSFKELSAELHHQDTSARRWAARDIALLEGATPILFTALKEEQEPVVIEALFDALENIATDEVVQGLMPMLRSEDTAKRNKVIEILQTMPDFVALYIIELLNDTDSDVRIFAVDILQELAHPDTPKWLLSVLKDETHINVVATTVDRLAEVGTLDMLDEIQSLKDRFPNEPYLHFAIDLALSRIKGE